MKYYSFNQYLRNTFGCKVYKISINAGFKHICLSFIRQSYYNVRYNINACIFQPFYCVVINIKRVSAAYVFSRFCVNRLQAEFNKNRLDFVQLFKKINRIIRQAIRSCCNGKCIFCSKGGSGDFAESSEKSITEQIESGKQ